RIEIFMAGVSFLALVDQAVLGDYLLRRIEEGKECMPILPQHLLGRSRREDASIGKHVEGGLAAFGERIGGRSRHFGLKGPGSVDHGLRCLANTFVRDTTNETATTAYIDAGAPA